ncbi:uncharacterized protein LOC129775551 [Toxorhynchites rutilus septentrionalis]|uniref:uncharacterized protein LOC129775551 n=1 Tax=Toxorhynchites rutilus septentrionalis TaxID=329112 RepID=UPI002478D12E|nr:uncharacterized protein LOC129775551 [Toxorhynchites rutilus septentrionalis]
MSRALNKSKTMVPKKKFFRYVLKGADFFRIRNGNSFTLSDLVSFAYLKNQRVDRLELVETMVKQAVDQLISLDLMSQSCGGKLHMNQNNSHRRESTRSNSAAPVECIQITNEEISEEEVQPVPGTSGESSQSPRNEAPWNSKDEKFTITPLKRKLSSSTKQSSSDTEEQLNSGNKPKRNTTDQPGAAELDMDLALVPNFLPIELPDLPSNISHRNGSTPSNSAPPVESFQTTNVDITEEEVQPQPGTSSSGESQSQSSRTEAPRNSKDEEFTVTPLKRKLSSSSKESSLSDTEEQLYLGNISFSKLLKRRKGKETMLPKHKRHTTDPPEEAELSMDLALVPDFLPIKLPDEEATTAQEEGLEIDQGIPQLKLSVLRFGSEEDDSD